MSKMVRSTTSRPVDFLLDWIAVQSSASSWFWLVWGTVGVLYGGVTTWRDGSAVASITTYAIALALVLGQGWLLLLLAATGVLFVSAASSRYRVSKTQVLSAITLNFVVLAPFYGVPGILLYWFLVYVSAPG